MNNKRKPAYLRLPGHLLMAASLLAPVTGALAQTDASLVTPRDLRPAAPPAAPGPLLEQQEVDVNGRLEAAPVLRVTPGRIEIADGFPELQAASEVLVAPFSGRSTTVDELYTLADALEALYGSAGYVLVRVTIPPQEVRDGGPFRLRVLDGYLEALDLEAVPERLRPRLRATLEPVLGRGRLQRADIERALVLAGRTPGLGIRSTLVPGRDTAAALLVLEAQHDAFAGSLGTDNRLADTLGPWQATAQLQLNQLAAQGEQLYAYVSGHPDPDVFFGGGAKRQVAGAGINWPLGHDGLSLNLELTASDTRMVTDNVFIPPIRSRFDRASLRLGKPLLLSRRSELSLTAQFEMSRQENRVSGFDMTLYRDALRVLRVGLDARHQLDNGAQLSVFLQASQGLEQGARSIEAAETSGIPFSRIGARPDFSKLELSLAWSQFLSGQVLLVSTLRAQEVLRGPLPSAELFSLDGEDALSALVSGRLADDSGWTWRNEFSRGVLWPRAGLQLVPFAYLTFGEPGTEVGETLDSGLAAGLGLRSSWRAFNLSLEYGRSRLNPGSFSDETFFASLRMVF